MAPSTRITGRPFSRSSREPHSRRKSAPKMSEHFQELATRARLLGAAAISTVVLVGCGSDVSSRGAGAGNQQVGGSGPSAGGGSGANSGSLGGLNVGSTGDSGTAGDTCATTSAGAMLVKQPVDIILVLDNSGSMADELSAVE